MKYGAAEWDASKTNSRVNIGADRRGGVRKNAMKGRREGGGWGVGGRGGVREGYGGYGGMARRATGE